MQLGLSAKDIRLILKRLEKIEDSIKAIKKLIEDRTYTQSSVYTMKQVLHAVKEPKTPILCGSALESAKNVKQSTHIKRKPKEQP